LAVKEGKNSSCKNRDDKMITHILEILLIAIWFWMGYASWRRITEGSEYIHFSTLLGLVACVIASPLVFLVVIMNDDKMRKDLDFVVCKRWLSRKEKIEKVKQEITR
jgi:hypothetical protein